MKTLAKLTLLTLTSITFNFQLLTFNCSAQDIHFSQFNQIPLIINPSLTGVFNGDQRAIINYKDQWKKFGAPYKTYALSFDMALFKKKWKNSYLGAGLTAFNDKAGDSELSQSEVNVSLSSIVSLNDNNKISVGLQGGFAQRSINFSNLTWDEQYDDINYVYNASSPSNESADASTSFTFGDFAAGLTWSFGTGKSSNNPFRANLGISLTHINQPKQLKYLSTGETENLFMRIAVHSSAYINMNENTSLLPSVLLLKQGPSTEVNLGTMIRFMLKEEKRKSRITEETALSLGGYFRAKDAFIPAVMFEFSKFALGVSYDVNVSDLKKASGSQGGIEISLKYVNPSPFRYNRGNKNSTVRFL